MLFAELTTPFLPHDVMVSRKSHLAGMPKYSSLNPGYLTASLVDLKVICSDVILRLSSGAVALKVARTRDEAAVLSKRGPVTCP